MVDLFSHKFAGTPFRFCCGWFVGCCSPPATLFLVALHAPNPRQPKNIRRKLLSFCCFEWFLGGVGCGLGKEASGGWGRHSPPPREIISILGLAKIVQVLCDYGSNFKHWRIFLANVPQYFRCKNVIRKGSHKWLERMRELRQVPKENHRELLFPPTPITSSDSDPDTSDSSSSIDIEKLND